MALFHDVFFHPNNSIINIDEIGEEAMALLCFTNKLTCCEAVSSRSGEWYFPNGSAVEKENRGGDMYRDRGPSVVRLNQKSTSSSPSGVFHCEIPLKNGTNQSIYAGIYPSLIGKIVCIVHPSGAFVIILYSCLLSGEPKIQNFIFDADEQMLICKSANGPATYVTWMRNELELPIHGNMYTQVQQIANMTESIYVNTLKIRGIDLSQVAGNYNCSVSNLRGSSEQALEIKGEYILI